MKKILFALVLLISVSGCIPDRHYVGLKPISPETDYYLLTTVDTLQPEFRWEPALEEGTTYDFCLWEATTSFQRQKGFLGTGGTQSWGTIVYCVENLRDPQYKPDKPLEPETLYNWSVRKRRGSNVSSWSAFDQTTTVLIGGGTTSMSNVPFRFITPAIESSMGENAPQVSYRQVEAKQLDPEIKQDYREIETDGRFTVYDNGIVYDGHTGLEWYAGPNQDTNWDEANQWVKSLTVAGNGWRLPTREELKSLYIKGAGENNMPPLLKTDGFYFWSGEKKWSTSFGGKFYSRLAWGFSYDNSGDWWDTNESGDVRSLAVRSR